ncbi:MAG: hypothetical protein FGM14_10420 [Flavobacteriales bacterium]|nr:hypothetical protein [Flavobacteriales bacterium]
MNQLEINDFFNNQEFIEKTVAQIIKDFNSCGWEVCFESNSILPIKEDLTNQIASQLFRLSATELQQFIYTVDLQENKFLNAVTKNDDYKSLAGEILKREALKVFIRSKYSH